MESKVSMRVDILANATLREAVEEAIQLAKRLDVAYIKFSFNDAEFWISQHADVEEVLNAYSPGVSKFLIFDKI